MLTLVIPLAIVAVGAVLLILVGRSLVLDLRPEQLRCDCGRWVDVPGQNEMIVCECGTTFERNTLERKFKEWNFPKEGKK